MERTGYFLDELILWLASHAADPAWVNREGQKVAKLVEAAKMDRALPIVSFIARQRDLRELVGEPNCVTPMRSRRMGQNASPSP